MKYEKISHEVEAVQYLRQSIEELQKIFGDVFYIGLYNKMTIKSSHIRINKSDWIVAELRGIKIYANEGFKRMFRQC